MLGTVNTELMTAPGFTMDKINDTVDDLDHFA